MNNVVGEKRGETNGKSGLLGFGATEDRVAAEDSFATSSATEDSFATSTATEDRFATSAAAEDRFATSTAAEVILTASTLHPPEQGAGSNYQRTGEESLSSLDRLAPDSNSTHDLVFRGLTRFQITVEPLFFLLMFNNMFVAGIMINLLQRHACNQVLGLHNISCVARPNTTEADQISSISAQVNMINSLVQMICPLVLSLFAGPWSDKNGRKPFMVIPMAGYTAYYAAVGIMAWFPSMDPMYFIIPSIPLSISGTMMLVYLCSYCYLCDIFDNEKRSIRFSINWSICLVGMVVANSSVTSIFNSLGEYGFQGVFFISSASALLGCLYTHFLLKETIRKNSPGYSCLIDLNYAKDVAMVILIHPKDGHLKVLLNVFITVSVGAILLGEGSVEYLIGQIQYNWTLGTYSFFVVVTVLWSAACCAALPMLLRRLLNMRDESIVMLSGLVLMLSELSRALSSTQLIFWISTGFMRQYSVVAPIMNAMMADLVTLQDMGKLYAFTGLVDTVTNYIGVPVYTVLYQYLLTRHQVLYTFLLSSAFGVLITSSALALRIMAKQRGFQSTRF